MPSWYAKDDLILSLSVLKAFNIMLSCTIDKDKYARNNVISQEEKTFYVSKCK